MMPRARLNSSGLKIAFAGRNVDEGDIALAFSSVAVNMPIYLKGTLAMSGASNVVISGTWGNFTYKIVTVGFGKTFSVPPIVFFGVTGSNGRLALPSFAQVLNGLNSGTPWYEYLPEFVSVSTSQFDFFTPISNRVTLAYAVMENTIS